MGCDIHAFVEFKDKKDKRNDPYWRSYSDEIDLGRNYYMFGCLTNGNVRQSVKLKNGVDPKGLPDKVSFTVEVASTLYITKTGEGDNETTLEKAKRWAEGGRCKLHYRDSDPTNPFRVDHPDWHNHSWLTCDEYGAIIKEAKKNKDDDEWVGVDYLATLDLMKSFDKRGMDVRLVFYFDN